MKSSQSYEDQSQLAQQYIPIVEIDLIGSSTFFLVHISQFDSWELN